jgi:hypothetical protein
MYSIEKGRRNEGHISSSKEAFITGTVNPSFSRYFGDNIPYMFGHICNSRNIPLKFAAVFELN